MNNRFAPTALMLGNIVTGCSVLAPAGMLSELSESLGVSIRTAGLLITFGAVVLCVGSAVTAWLTSRVERRTLLVATLAVLALTNAASALAPDYAALLVIRLIMLAVGVIYTPQAAGTAALVVPVEKRGWQAVYGSIGAMGVLSSLLLVWRLPGRLRAAPVDLKTWIDLGRNRAIILLLSITALQTSGQFTVFTFMGPLLKKLTDANPDAIGLVFALYGIAGFVGILIATRIVDSWCAYKTSLLFNALVMTGVTGWALSAGLYVLMAVAVAVWGLGFASTNSMQQVRLVAAAPPLAPASVALNTSVLYVGQAVGSFVGGLFYARELLYGLGFVAMAFVALAVMLVIASQPRAVPAE